MTTIELFKNLWYDDKRRLPLFSSITAQNTYFNSLPYTNKTTFSEANFNKVGDPMLLSLAFDEALDYKSGRFLFGSKWFYFQIVNLEVNTNTRTRIIYKIDTWLTTRYQYNTTFGVGHITRRNNFTGRSKQPHTPIKTSLLTKNIIGEQGYAWAIGCYTPKDDTTGSLYYFAFPVKSDNTLLYIGGSSKYCPNFQTLQGCTFDDIMNIPPANIKGLWLSPIGPVSMSETDQSSLFGGIWQLKSTGLFPDSTLNTDWYESIQPKSEILEFNGSIYTDEMHIGGICDRKGNPVFTLPYGKTITNIKAQLRISAQTCQVDILTNDYINDNLNELKCSIECEPISFTLDQYSQYFSGQRQVEIQQRLIQSEQAFVTSLAQSGNSALWGGIAGGVAGAGIGLAVGIGGAMIGLASDNNYNSKLQALTDLSYQYAPDTMSIIGTCINDFLEDFTGYYSFMLIADSYSITRMNTDIETAGCYVDEISNNMESYFGDGKVLQADVEVLGNIPSNWKADLQQRIANGVTMELIL